MPSKKRKMPTVEEILERPWCYYCDRDFDDLKVLMEHQKAKHFKCPRCGRRLNTAGGLSVHMSQVHKEQLTAVDNAVKGRDDPSSEIFAMEGIPHDLVESHRQKILTEYYRKEAEHRMATGNPPKGTKTDEQPNKRAKKESKEEIKARLVAMRARKQAEREGRTSSNGDSPMPMDGVQSDSPAVQSPAGITPWPPPPYDNLPRSLMAQQVEYQQRYPTALQQVLPHSVQLAHHKERSQPFFASGMTSISPPGMPPFSPPGMPSFSSPGMPPFKPHWREASASNPGQQALPAFQGPPPPEPAQVDEYKALEPQAAHTLPTSSGLPRRPSFNPPAMSKEDMGRLHSGGQAPPGHAPHMPVPPASQLRAHDGRPDDVQTAAPGISPGFSDRHAENNKSSVSLELRDSVDDLIASVTGQKHPPTPSAAFYNAPVAFYKDSLNMNTASNAQAPASPDTAIINDEHLPEVWPTIIDGAIVDFPATSNEQALPTRPSKDVPLESTNPLELTHASMTPEPAKKKSKKDKKAKDLKASTKLIFDAGSYCPEEKLAGLQKYAFNRREIDMHNQEQVLGDIEAKLTGVVAGENDVKDSQDTH